MHTHAAAQLSPLVRCSSLDTCPACNWQNQLVYRQHLQEMHVCLNFRAAFAESVVVIRHRTNTNDLRELESLLVAMHARAAGLLHDQSMTFQSDLSGWSSKVCSVAMLTTTAALGWHVQRMKHNCKCEQSMVCITCIKVKQWVTS